MTDCSRRRLLALGTAVTVGAVAGCTGTDENTVGTPGVDGPVLETLSLENLNNHSHTLDIVIQWDDEIEYWEAHELDAISDGGASSLVLAEGWPTEPGEFQLTVRLDSDTRVRFSSTELPDRECQNLVILISREGTLSILTDVSGGACSDDEPDTDDSD